MNKLLIWLGLVDYLIQGDVHSADLVPATIYIAHKKDLRFGLESSIDWSATGAIPVELVLSLDKDDEQAVRAVAELICTGEFTVRKVEAVSPGAEAPASAGIRTHGVHQLSTPAKVEQYGQTQRQAAAASKFLLSSEQKEPAANSSHVPSEQKPLGAPSKEAVPRVSAGSIPGHFLGYVPDFVSADWHRANPRPRQRDPQGRLRRGRKGAIAAGNWIIHMLVIQQRSTWIVIPDVLLAQRVWGDQKQWPVNWRQYLAKRLGGRGSPLKCQRPCPAECPMHDSPIRHGHFHYKILSIQDCQHRDQTFLGALETFGYLDDQLNWRYDFSKPTGNKDEIETAQKLIDKDRKQGRLVAVYLPLLIFGPARQLKLSYEQRQLLLALTHELSRGSAKTRPDRAQIIIGGQKSIGKEGARVGVYPQLQAGQSYVGFNGNASKRRNRYAGRGYRLIGRQYMGWLNRAGYDIPADKKGQWKAVAGMLKDLDALAVRFGLVVAGWHPEKKQWKSLAEMRAIVEHRDGQRWLDSCLLRVYTPADYLVRWRKHFAERMGFTAIPGGQEEEIAVSGAEPETPGNSPALELDRWMNQVGLSNEQLASKLKVSAAWVSKQRSGKSRWSKGFEEKLKAVQAAMGKGSKGI
jgi:hypothetical protein